MLLEKLNLSNAKFHEFCQRWQVIELSLFGSILRDDFRSDSDVDILVNFAPQAPWDLLDLVEIQQELGSMLARKVDLIEKRVIESSPNWIRRKEILGTAKVIYSQSHELLISANFNTQRSSAVH